MNSWCLKYTAFVVIILLFGIFTIEIAHGKSPKGRGGGSGSHAGGSRNGGNSHARSHSRSQSQNRSHSHKSKPSVSRSRSHSPAKATPSRSRQKASPSRSWPKATPSRSRPKATPSRSRPKSTPSRSRPKSSVSRSRATPPPKSVTRQHKGHSHFKAPTKVARPQAKKSPARVNPRPKPHWVRPTAPFERRIVDKPSRTPNPARPQKPTGVVKSRDRVWQPPKSRDDRFRQRPTKSAGAGVVKEKVARKKSPGRNVHASQQHGGKKHRDPVVKKQGGWSKNVAKHRGKKGGVSHATHVRGDKSIGHAMHRNRQQSHSHKDIDRRHKAGHYERIAHSNVGRKIALDKQFSHRHKGDVARRMHLDSQLKKHGGWHHRHHHGPISKHYLHHHFAHHYLGPHRYPRHTWYPRWYGWVGWSWSARCSPGYDPRPIVVRPYEYPAGPQLTNFDAPEWQLLYNVPSGTWVNVPPPNLLPGADDLQLLAVRFVDPGHPERDLGPRYRVWFRNNSQRAIDSGFNVLVLVSVDQQASEQNPQASVRVSSIDALAIKAVDLRLPMASATMARDEQGRAAPFTQLHVIVDSHVETTGDAIPLNNGAVVPRLDVLPVDPALFSADRSEGAVGSFVNLAGEGLGPEPGQVIISVGDLQLNAQIEGWYDLGIRVKLPELQLAGAQEVKILVIRGDSAASNPIPFTLLPKTAGDLPAAEPLPVDPASVDVVPREVAPLEVGPVKPVPVDPARFEF